MKKCAKCGKQMGGFWGGEVPAANEAKLDQYRKKGHDIPEGLCVLCSKEYIGAIPDKPLEEKESCVGEAIVSFFIPFMGLFFYILWKKTDPKRANVCCIGSIIGLVFTAVVIAKWL